MKLIPTQRILRNGTKDEVNVTEGIKTQRIKKYVAQANDIGLYSLYEEVDLAYFTLPDMALSTDAYKLTGLASIEGMSEVKWSDRRNVNNIGKITIQPNVARVWIIVAKEKYAENAEKAREDLVGTTLTYQLARPKIYQSKFIY